MIAVVAFTPSASGQLAVHDFSLGGAYFVNAFEGSDSGDFTVSQVAEGYSVPIPEATLTDEAGTRSATFNGGFEGQRIESGFRVFGSVFASEQDQPFFYDARFGISGEVAFEITTPTPVRVAGRLEHDPLVGPGSINAFNATEFSLSAFGVDPEVFLEARVGPIDGLPAAVDLDETVVLAPGFYRIDIDSATSGLGTSSPGLRSINTFWDLSVTAVPAPATFAVAPIALLALRRRR
ncbi:MAG: hypothetical protein AAF937_07555 [Planctomycetota bacterium]